MLLATAGTTRLATAGTGDVLSGVIGALCARGLEPRWAAALAAHVHGRAARRGPAEGLVAGDLPYLVAEVLSDLVVAAGRADSRGPGGRLAARVGRRRPRRGPAQRVGARRGSPGRRRSARWSRPTATGTAAPEVALAALEGGAELAGGRPGRGGDRPPRRRHRRAGAPPLGAAGRRAARRRRAPPASRPSTPTGRSARSPRWSADAGSQPVEVHLKVDTGMHRVGADPDEVVARWSTRSPADASLRLGALWTHLAVADGASEEDRGLHRRRSSTASTRALVELAVARAPAATHCMLPTPPARSRSRRSPRPGAVRDLALRRRPDPRARGRTRSAAPVSPSDRCCHSARRWPASAGCPRGSAPPTAAAARSRWSRPWRPCRSATRTACPRRLFDVGGEVLVGGVPAPARRGGDDGPDHDRLRTGRRRRTSRSATRWCCSAGRATGRSSADEWAEPARDDQLRGALRDRSDECPGCTRAARPPRPLIAPVGG